MDLHQYFEYKEKGKTITFKETNEDGLICYNCGKKYKKIIVHLSIKENCRGNINIGHLVLYKKMYGTIAGSVTDSVNILSRNICLEYFNFKLI